MDTDVDIARPALRMGGVLLGIAVLVVAALFQTKTIPNPLTQQQPPPSGYFIRPYFYDQGRLVDEIPISIRGPQRQTLARPDCVRGDCSIEIDSKNPFEMPGPGTYHVVVGGYYSGYDVTDRIVTIPAQRGSYRVDFVMLKTYVYRQQLMSTKTAQSALIADRRIASVAK